MLPAGQACQQLLGVLPVLGLAEDIASVEDDDRIAPGSMGVRAGIEQYPY